MSPLPSRLRTSAAAARQAADSIADHVAAVAERTTTAPASGPQHRTPELHPLSLRFRDDRLETRYRASYIRDNLVFIRLAHLLGMASWAIFGLWRRSCSRRVSKPT